VPDLGRWLNRRPTYNLTRAPSRISEGETPGVTPTPTKDARPQAAEATIEEEPATEQPTVQRTWSWQRQPRPERSHSISSVLTESHYAVLPHGVTLDDWPEEDKEALDDHVRHMLHSRRSKFKQRMRAFGKYISKRECPFRRRSNYMLTCHSSWILRHLVCYAHYFVRFGLGSVLDR
jgi:hypothetical protein